MLRRLVKKGELIVVDHDGKTYRYGAPDPEHGPITVRLTDRRAANTAAVRAVVAEITGDRPIVRAGSPARARARAVGTR